MKKSQLVFFFLSFLSVSHAQMKGVIYGSNNEQREKLIGARIALLNNKTGTLSDKEGQFELTLPKNLPDTLIISAIGYLSDTIIVTKKDRFISIEIVLFSDELLPEIIVEARKSTHSVLRMKTLHTEELGAGELRKAACCNLSESFETNASVDVNITDAVSGAKKIQMMGLDGVYTQIQLENIPYLRGLESAYGLNSISGTWIQSIQITKGTGNVVNGYESMAGLINLELKKPIDMERLYLNFYTNRFGRLEANYNGGKVLNKKWSTGNFVHASGMPFQMDNNKDGFRDIPLGYNAAILNRWHYNGKRMEAQLAVNGYLDSKFGGQMDSPNILFDKPYIVQMETQHLDIIAKTGFFFAKKPYQSVGIVYNLKYQQLDANFGNRHFIGEEKRAYVNGIFDGIIGNTNHKIKTGASLVYIDMLQHLDSSQVNSLTDDRIEIVPGVYGEYTYTGMRLVNVLGARIDYHNLFEWQFSPRLHSKYTLNEKTDLRFTIGKGWRVPNYMIDNLSLLANARSWVVTQELKPEISWNTGASLVRELRFFSNKSSLVIDYYHTEFTDQLIVDRDSINTAIVFKNLEGRSFSNSFQVEWSFIPFKYFDIRLAYKYLDVRSKLGQKVQQQVMLPKHRALVNLSYKTRNKRWEYDLTCNVFGQARLPEAHLPDGTITQTNVSKVYAMLHAQVTHVYKKWDFYLGGENLTNYTQKNAIIDAANPFGSTFDATRLWAPIMGINIYAGIRYTLPSVSEKGE